MNTILNNLAKYPFLSDKIPLSSPAAQFSNFTEFPGSFNAGSKGTPSANQGPLVDYVYANGYVKAEFTSKGLRKEFERCLLSSNDSGRPLLYIPENAEALLRELDLSKNLEQRLYEVLSQPENTYIAREMTWTLVNSYGNDIYSLVPSVSHLRSLIAASEPRGDKLPRPIMLLGEATSSPISELPVLDVRKIEAVRPSSIIKSITSTNPDMNVDKLKNIVAEILSLIENNGDNDKDRALNYLLYHNFAIYVQSYEIIHDNYTNNSNGQSAKLSSVQVLSQRSGDRIVAKIIFDYHSTNGNFGQSWYSAVDVTDEYPFLLVPFKRYLQRY